MSHETLLKDLDDYCQKAGVKPSTVCVRAVNDSRYPQRHQSRLDKIRADDKKIRAYMAANPPVADCSEVAAE